MARVAVDVPLAHLDRPFDYAVPEKFADLVQAGCRVRVRFHGRLVDGVVWELGETSDFAGKLQPLSHVPSGEPVLTPQVARLARVVADRYAGTVSDVLRLALPPRRAAAEKKESPTPDAAARAARPGRLRPATPPGRRCCRRWPRGARRGRFSTPSRGRTGRPGSWSSAAPRSPDGAGALVVVPDGKDLDRLTAAAQRLLPEHSFTVLRADDPPERRYRRFLAASRGAAQVVLGTRAAMFAPVRDLGLVVVWDDGDDLHADEHAPYPHARDVLVQRAWLHNCAAVVAGTARTAEAALLVESGWAHELVADRSVLRSAAPRVQALGEDFELARDPAARSARLPSLAHGVARTALAAGAPVLVQVPRAGYVPSLACARCRAPARCAHCAGPLGISPRPGPGGSRIPACRWCARPATTFDCPHCHGTKLRAAVIGESRTAEELARAFPGAAVRVSGRGERCAGHRARRAGAGRGHARCRAGGRGRVRRGAAARLVGAAGPGRPAGGGGDAAPLDECGGAGAAGLGRRARGRRGRRQRTPSSRRWCAGTRAGWPSASSPTVGSWASRRSPGWPR